jgi:hypothetical protein
MSDTDSDQDNAVNAPEDSEQSLFEAPPLAEH